MLKTCVNGTEADVILQDIFSGNSIKVNVAAVGTMTVTKGKSKPDKIHNLIYTGGRVPRPILGAGPVPPYGTNEFARKS